MRPKRLTERKAWLRIRRSFNAVANGKHVQGGELGICAEIQRLKMRGLIDWKREWEMNQTLIAQHSEIPDWTGIPAYRIGLFWFRLDEEGARLRVKLISRILRKLDKN